MSRLIIATNNQGKVREIKAILGDFFDEVLSLKDVGLVVDVEEDGKTFHENASKKAIEVSKLVEGTVLADDSGLCVDALDGAPGIYSARFGGEEANDAVNNQKLLESLLGKENRTARFVAAIVLAQGGKEILYAEDFVEGKILQEAHGSGGFGYDPLFFVEEYDMTFGEIAPEIKNKISHRAKALQQIKNRLQKV